MSTNCEIKFIDVDNNEELVSYFPAIEKLFLEAFGKPLCFSMWKWAYQQNPFGEPLVSMAFCDEELVGHYAVVPMKLQNDEQILHGYLSMTTMVSVNFRKHNLFKTLAERVYTRIKDRESAAVVFGFPNDQSAPGFRKRLGWTISDDFHVLSLRPRDLVNVEEMLTSRNKAAYYLDLKDDFISDWRTRKPNQEWKILNGVGIKKHDFGLDLMYLDKYSILSELFDEDILNAIIPISKDKAAELGLEISFPYRFGYRTFNMYEVPEFFVQMCMSDVF